jgi:hypothetical protein
VAAVDYSGADFVVAERLPRDPSVGGEIPAQQRGSCIIGGERFRRQQTLVPDAAVCEQAQVVVMEKTNVDLSVLKKQGEELQKQVADTATTLRVGIQSRKQFFSYTHSP